MNFTKYIYVYSDGCSPCRAITPIIDTFIALGYEIEKMSIEDYAKNGRSIPTPAIFSKDMPNTIYGQELAPLAQLSVTHPELLQKNLSEYLRDLFSNCKKKVDK